MLQDFANCTCNGICQSYLSDVVMEVRKRDLSPKQARFRCYGKISEFLGYTKRSPIPNCVTEGIRKEFPDVDGNYVGYKLQ